MTFCLKEKKKYHEVHKKELNRTLCLFLLICFCSFFIYVCIFHCLYFALLCCEIRGSFLLFPFSYNFVYRISGTPYLKFLANLCREEENLVFWFGAQFISRLKFTQSGWLILFSPDLHFRLAKRVSDQTYSLRRETATRTDVPLDVPA